MFKKQGYLLAAEKGFSTNKSKMNKFFNYRK